MSTTKSKSGNYYLVILLRDKSITDDLNDCLIVSCTNKNVLSEISGIPYHRLVYVFTKLHKNVLHEDGVFIVKSNLTYKGKQVGGLRNKDLSGYNRNR